MRVFNLTDVPTEQLTQLGLVRQPLGVGRFLVPPGGHEDIPDDPIHTGAAQYFQSVGAVAVGSLPPTYVLAKGKQEPVVKKTKKRRG
jgi:hypothetical protein